MVVGWITEAPSGASNGATPPSLRRLETLVNGEIAQSHAAALLRVQDNEIAILCAVDASLATNGLPPLAEAICRRAAEEFPQARLACGVSRPASDISQWRTAYREALQALAMARRLREVRPLHFSHLSVYRLLLQLEGHPELTAFYQETLGRLAEYDRHHSAQLLETLAAYFDNNGNLSQTAEALCIHRNSLMYRMERIADIGGFDLNDPETRLAVHLALTIRRLISTEGS